MRLKLDENLGRVAVAFLEDAGWDVSSVARQNLCGAPDSNLIQVCAAESRCLVTLDLDFSNPLQFPPERYAGIVVLRLPKRPSGEDIIDCLKTLVAAVPPGESLVGTLRVISKGRVREYEKDR